MQDVELLHGNPLVHRLNSLVQLDFDAIASYEHAIEHCDDARVRRDLELFRGDHQRHIADLGKVIHALDGRPIDVHLDLKGVVLEGLTTVRSYGGTLAALRAMRTNERFTNYSYRKTASIALAPIARIVVAQNYADEQRHLAMIEAHIDRMTGTAVVTNAGIPIVFDDLDPIPTRRG